MKKCKECDGSGLIKSKPSVYDLSQSSYVCGHCDGDGYTSDVMSLKGGLNQYTAILDFGSRYMDGEPPKGRKVKFLNENGYDSEREHAAKFFKTGEILTIEEIYVGRSSSTVEFEGIEGKFNTVMFADVE